MHKYDWLVMWHCVASMVELVEEVVGEEIKILFLISWREGERQGHTAAQLCNDIQSLCILRLSVSSAPLYPPPLCTLCLYPPPLWPVWAPVAHCSMMTAELPRPAAGRCCPALCCRSYVYPAPAEGRPRSVRPRGKSVSSVTRLADGIWSQLMAEMMRLIWHHPGGRGWRTLGRVLLYTLDSASAATCPAPLGVLARKVPWVVWHWKLPWRPSQQLCVTTDEVGVCNH